MAPELGLGLLWYAVFVVSLNLILLVFNLLPLPPLDGSEILSDRSTQQYRAMMAQPAAQMLGLVVAWNLIDFLLDPAQLIALNLLYPGAGYH